MANGDHRTEGCRDWWKLVKGGDALSGGGSRRRVGLDWRAEWEQDYGDMSPLNKRRRDCIMCGLLYIGMALWFLHLGSIAKREGVILVRYETVDANQCYGGAVVGFVSGLYCFYRAICTD